MTATNDSSELEALFDSIASCAPAAVSTPAPTAAGDSDDLQALFDSVSAETAQSTPVAPVSSDEVPSAWPVQENVFNRIGLMARQLHDTLHGLGYDKLLEKTVTALPDAKDRLAYVANLTEQAACRVLNATDIAVPMVEGLETSAQALAGRWDEAFANRLDAAAFKQLAVDTKAFLAQGLPEKTQPTKAQLTEIMMAQDFQDLTGQVIKKIVGLAQELESGLMTVLLEVAPEAKRTTEVTSLMNGPVINAEGRVDVVVNQQQVDDLLDSLGF